MNKKSPSNQLARECIVTALVHLSKQKPFSNITISELTEKAGVSRMTYYRNYHSKEEVFQQYINEVFDQYRQEAQLLHKGNNFGEYQNILHCFQYFETYNEFISCLLQIDMGHMILSALTDYVMETYYTKKEPSRKLYYTLIAYAGALFGVYMAWVADGMKETPEELANLLHVPEV